MNRFHLFGEEINGITIPERLNNPFSYRPHQLCLIASEQVREYVKSNEQWSREVEKGKMFGVLAVRDKDGRYGFLAAYSGLLDRRGDHDFFVPLVFDYMSPKGYFKQEEKKISEINCRIELFKMRTDYVTALNEYKKAKERYDSLVAEHKELKKKAKERRRTLRNSGTLSPEEEQRLNNESSYANAEYKRIERREYKNVFRSRYFVDSFELQLEEMKYERKRRSVFLQQWLFGNFVVCNSLGEESSLSQIFLETPQLVPPSGTGECAAPKLLQYAFKNNFIPLAMAEFWMGRSPVGTLRRDGCFYGACVAKCRPILDFMLKGMELEPPLAYGKEWNTDDLDIVYEDDCLLILNKPSGMLSVPGLTGGMSAEELLRCKYGNDTDIRAVHRLDMATSGLLVVAKSSDVFVALQKEFAERRVQKRYVAILDGIPATASGNISLPLTADYENRPCQAVDMENGKPAITEYELLEIVNYKGRKCAKVAFYPQTGRTHQLRVHAAHSNGLDTPIVGDELYGKADERLMLHAEYVSFLHPVTGVIIEVEKKGF